MCDCSRRNFLTYAGIGAIGLLANALPRRVFAASSVSTNSHNSSNAAARFIDVAFEMKAKAIASGDQSYGAVLVLNNKIIGWGPSRVIVDSNEDAHAERVAMWDAQKKRGNKDLRRTILYSTSRPCRHCQDFAARHGVAKMIHGRQLNDAGAPLRYGD